MSTIPETQQYEEPENFEDIESLIAKWETKMRFFLISQKCPLQDLDEVVQDTLIGAWKNLSKYKPIGDFGSWMCGIAMHKLSESRRQMHRKMRKNELSLSIVKGDYDTDYEIIDPHGEQPIDFLISCEICSGLRNILHMADEFDICLGESTRLQKGLKALQLRGLHQISYREIAKQLDITESSLKTNIFVARNFLREKIFPELFGKKQKKTI